MEWRPGTHQEWVSLPAYLSSFYPFGTAGSNDICSRGDRNRVSFSSRTPKAPYALIDSFFVERLDEEGFEYVVSEGYVFHLPTAAALKLF
jgi:hypothetical protein